ncbi:MAG: Adenylosuccinate synthetase [Candidatus Saccharibacteria bacterium]|nr:Adenylosuccinate synthetase [Candidatus Saccharibacteria bacterium]
MLASRASIRYAQIEMPETVPNTVIVGEQRGDEAKGAFIDRLAHEFDLVARFNGGQNAGHKVFHNGRILSLHGVPSGIAHPGTINVIGNGTLMNAAKLSDEIDSVREQGIEITPDNLKISSAMHLVLPHHEMLDSIRENGTGAQGSTKSGIAQVASAKSERIGLQVGKVVDDEDTLCNAVTAGITPDIIDAVNQARELKDMAPLHVEEIVEEYIQKARKLADFIIDTPIYLNEALSAGNSLLAEGAQAFLLDVDHGMYPFVTSTGTTSGAVSPGLGVPPSTIERVIGVVKATQSHVGGGPFVTEIHDPERLEVLVGKEGEVDSERGTTTGRIRRMGHLDIAGIRRAQMVNGTHEMALSKLDCVPRYGATALVCVGYNFNGQNVKIAPGSGADLEKCQPVYEELPTWEENIQDIRDFDDLPKNAQHYIKFIEDQTDVPITMIGVGPGRDQYITREA